MTMFKKIDEYFMPDRTLRMVKFQKIYKVQEEFRSEKGEQVETLLATTNKKEAAALFQGIRHGARIIYQMFRNEKLEDHKK